MSASALSSEERPAFGGALSGETRPELRRGLYVVLTNPRDGYERLCECAVEAGVPAVQFRPKGDPFRSALRVAQSLRSITRGSRTLLMVNDRPDLALLCEADGVHLGQTDVPPADVRQLMGPHPLIGFSTHSLAQVRAANDEADVDYIGYGPLYSTPSKENPDPVVGPETLRDAIALSRHPVVAIGGLDGERIRRLDRRGLRCAAVIRAVALADHPLKAMRTLNDLLMEQNS